MALRSASRCVMLAARSCQPAASGCGMGLLQPWLQPEPQSSTTFPRLNDPPFSRSQWSGPRRDILVHENMMELLQSTNVIRLKQDLEDEARSKCHTTYTHLLSKCLESGAASNQQEAEALAKSLVQAGVVLKFGDIIYLRPAEIAEIIVHALPGTLNETKQKLEKVEAELESLLHKNQTIEAEARKWPNFFLYGGCSLLAIQLIAFARLTFYELSWDVMEPIAYLISLFYTLVGYIYFLMFRSGYDYPIFEEFWKSRNKVKKYKEANFDPERLQYLLKLKSRYREHLAAISLSKSKVA